MGISQPVGGSVLRAALAGEVLAREMGDVAQSAALAAQTLDSVPAAEADVDVAGFSIVNLRTPVSDAEAATRGWTLSEVADLALEDDTRFPTAAQKLALAGTAGTVGASNAYVTEEDARLTREVQIEVVVPLTAPVVGNGKKYFLVPAALDGWELLDAQASVVTASTSGAPSVMVANDTTGHDMLSTAITIDINEKSSYTGTTSVVNASFKTVSKGDLIRIDVDAVGTGTKGLIVTLNFGE